MKHWSAEFRPRSICNYGSDGDSGPSGDSGGGYTGDTGGDFFGSSDGGYYGTNDSGSFQGSDTGFQSTGGDSWTGSESGPTGFDSSSPGSFFGDSGPVSSDTGGGYYSGGGSEGGFIGPGGDYSGGGYDYSGSPYADYGPGPSFGMDPTGGVNFTDSGMGFGYGPGPAGNLGIGNAMGPPGAMTGDYGAYGSGTSTGFGPGAQGASIGGPGVYAAAPGINGFPGDFGAPPGGAFGMPNQGDVGPQAGPGLFGGPTTVQQGEALNPSLFGPVITSPEVTRPSDDRTEVDPTTVFGPEFATNQAGSNVGWFGPSQAQAGQNMTNQGVIDVTNMENAFQDVGKANEFMAQANPALMQALNNIAADPAYDPANYAGPSPGAQQGFTGTSAQQGTMSFDSFGGKGDSLNQSGRADVQQTNPNFDQIGPMVTQQGYQQLAAEMNAQQPQTQTPTVQAPQQEQATPQQIQQGYQTLADQMTQLATDFGPNYGPSAPGLAQPGQLGPGMVMADPTVTPGQQQFGDAIPGTQFAAQSRGSDQAPPWMEGERGPIESEMETIGLRPGEDVISSLFPATQGAGGGIGIPGLMSMYDTGGRPSGSPTGNPSQAGVGPFGPSTGRPGGDTSGRPGLSLTVGNNQYAAGRPGGGYYQTGGAGIAPGAKGAEYGGVYGRGDAYSTGRPGTNSFGAGGPGSWGAAAAAAARGDGGWFYDPGTGQYYQAGRR